MMVRIISQTYVIWLQTIHLNFQPVNRLKKILTLVPVPVCKYCRGKLSREEHHPVIRHITKTKPNVSYTGIRHFHLRCYDGIDKSFHGQLVTQLNIYDEMSKKKGMRLTAD